MEANITSPSLPKLSLDARVGVPEVWRYDGERLTMYRRAGVDYETTETSSVLPGVTSHDLIPACNKKSV
ncbi:MAG: Uma2 family endonuclease [Acidobacteria bacterium]|nr:Uma2 family endonuclease [Acidobacteriota bacterium]